MKVRFRYLDPRGGIIFCNLLEDEKACVQSIQVPSQRMGDRRAGRVVNNNGTVYVFSDNEDLVKSSKRFRFFCETLAEMVETFITSQSEYLDEISANTNRLIHNLTTLNAHNLQEIYNLIPQERLTQNPVKSYDVIEEKVREHPEEMARALLNLIKNFVATKAEFSVYRKLFEKQPSLQRQNHNVHKVLMNILHVFFSDFVDKGIKVKPDRPGELKAYFDYESIYVVFHHIIENAAKYALNDTSLKIGISETEFGVSIIFDMHSLEVRPEEYDQIFEEGYSGELPRITGKAGRGIGLQIAKRLVELNNGRLTFSCDSSTRTEHFGFPYQANKFTLDLPDRKHRRSDQ